MNESSQILPLVEGDVAELIRLARVIWRHHYPAMISREQIEYMLAQRYTPAAVRAQLSREDSWWDKLALADGMIGFVQYQLAARATGDRAMKLGQIYVHQDLQRHGHGASLLARVEGAARERACASVWLNVNRGNVNAIAAYRKHGYAIVARSLADIGGGFMMDDYVMEKTL